MIPVAAARRRVSGRRQIAARRQLEIQVSEAVTVIACMGLERV